MDGQLGAILKTFKELYSWPMDIFLYRGKSARLTANFQEERSMPAPKKEEFANEAHKNKCLKQRAYREKIKKEFECLKKRIEELENELACTQLALRIVRKMPEMIYGNSPAEIPSSQAAKEQPSEGSRIDSIADQEKSEGDSIASAQGEKTDSLAGNEPKKPSCAAVLTRQKDDSRE